MARFKEIRKNEEILAYLKKADKNLEVLGYTDHSAAHTTLVAERAAYILEQLGYTEHEKDLAKIAGFMHDIGNAVNFRFDFMRNDLLHVLHIIRIVLIVTEQNRVRYFFAAGRQRQCNCFFVAAVYFAV